METRVRVKVGEGLVKVFCRVPVDSIAMARPVQAYDVHWASTLHIHRRTACRSRERRVKNPPISSCQQRKYFPLHFAHTFLCLFFVILCKSKKQQQQLCVLSAIAYSSTPICESVIGSNLNIGKRHRPIHSSTFLLLGLEKDLFLRLGLTNHEAGLLVARIIIR